MDLEEFIHQLLREADAREKSTLTSRVYSDEPLLLTGRQLRERQEREADRRGREASRQDREASRQARQASRAASQRAREARIAERERQRAERRQQERETARGGLVADVASRPRQQSLDFTVPQRPSIDSVPLRSPYEGTETAVRADAGPIPQRYYDLRNLAEEYGYMGRSSARGMVAYGTRAANRLFYEQARLMEDFEDDYDFDGDYFQYFPTYASMTLSQLRGYFTWRTRVRAGQMPEAPLSFAFLLAYELLCGIGTTPGDKALADLLHLRDAFGATEAAQGSAFASYLNGWARDYVVYHGLDLALAPFGEGELTTAVHTLLRAEQLALAERGMARKEPPLEPCERPDARELTEALSTCASYQICGARLYKTNPDEVCEVTAGTFAELVAHCAKRRKTDFVEGLFGHKVSEPYTMFSAAVFFDPVPHEDVEVVVGPAMSFVCRDGRWRRNLLFSAAGRSRELGDVLHAVDQRLRQALDYSNPLKPRKGLPSYVGKIIDRQIQEMLDRKAEEERRRITIDLSQLAGIRAAAAMTQEALLTDEERDDVAETAPAREPLPVVEMAAEAPAPTPAATPERVGSSRQGAGSDGDSPLDPAEREVLAALLAGAPVPQNPGGQMLSLVIDAINEKLFDLVGDAVIEFDDDEPILVEDYVEDVREIV